MKKEMILEKWKTKTISLLMAGIMVFAMAPLGTAVAFADEENAEPAEEPAVEAVEEPTVVVEEDTAEEDVVVEAPKAIIEESATAPQVKAMEEEPREVTVKEGLLPFIPVIPAPGGAQSGNNKLKNLGVYTMDLSKGLNKVYFDFEGNMSSEAMVLYWILQVGNTDDTYIFGGPGATEGRTNLDIDGHGEAFDLEMYPEADMTDPEAPVNGFYVCFNKLSTSNIKENHTIMLTEADKQFFESFTDASASCPGYYSGVKFVFAKATQTKPTPKPVAKKANTLTVKAKKTTRIKAKKMRKKAKSFNISNFVIISNAQGKVTFTKASGNKKITVASNGKVTLKKKIKKGTYKVKVNVKAAGNANFNAVTKAVTFKVKVK